MYNFNPGEYKDFQVESGIDWETDHLGQRTGKGREWRHISWEVRDD